MNEIIQLIKQILKDKITQNLYAYSKTPHTHLNMLVKGVDNLLKLWYIFSKSYSTDYLCPITYTKMLIKKRIIESCNKASKY